MSEHPFTEGTKVALVSRNRWDRGLTYCERIVGKVRKDGKFTLVGDAQQYRPSFFDGAWRARATGGGYDKDDVELITDGLITEAAITKRFRAFAQIIREIDTRGRGLKRDEVTEQIYADAVSLHAKLERPSND